MAISVSWLLQYAKAQVGRPYWYGSHGQIASKSLYNSLKASYPSYYTASDFASQYGLKVHDCSGLIKGAQWCSTVDGEPTYVGSQDRSSAGMYSYASNKGKISSFPKKNGYLVFRGSSPSSIHHVGIYCADDGYVYEAKGHAYGVVKTKYVQSDWDYWCEYPDVDYSNSSSSSGTTSGTTNVLKEAKGFDDSLAGEYKVNASNGLNVRYGAGSGEALVTTISNGSKVHNYGYYTTVNGVKWLLVVLSDGETKGYCSSEYLTKISSSSSTTTTKKSNEEIAMEVVNGEWGNGDERKQRLTAAGYDYNAIQKIVNEYMSGVTTSKKSPTYAVGQTYTTQVDHLAVRSGPGTQYSKKTYNELSSNGKANAHSDGCYKKGTRVTCQGIEYNGNDVWILTPSGYIAGYYSENDYIL